MLYNCCHGNAAAAFVRLCHHWSSNSHWLGIPQSGWMSVRAAWARGRSGEQRKAREAATFVLWDDKTTVFMVKYFREYSFVKYIHPSIKPIYTVWSGIYVCHPIKSMWLITLNLIGCFYSIPFIFLIIFNNKHLLIFSSNKDEQNGNKGYQLIWYDIYEMV